MADNTARIAQIESILEAGARSVVIDGVTVAYDFDSLRTELRRLKATDDIQKKTRPRVLSFDLRRAF